MGQRPRPREWACGPQRTPGFAWSRRGSRPRQICHYRAERVASIVDFVFELPSRRELRHRVGQADQETSVPFQRARPDIEYLAEQLRADAVVLIVPVRELSDFAGFTIVLEAR